MPINLTSQFSERAKLPLEYKMISIDLTARDAINATERYEGLFTYVTSNATTYQLQGGITNADWVAITGAGGAAPVDASYITLSGNSTLTQERVLTAGTGVTFVDTGANGTLTISTSGAYLDANYLRLDSTNDPVTGDTDWQWSGQSFIANSDIVDAGGHAAIPNDPTEAFGSNGQAIRWILAWVQDYRMRQSCNITRLKFRILDLTDTTSIQFGIWRKKTDSVERRGLYDLVAITENLVSSLSVGLNDITLGADSVLYDIKPGDFMSVRITQSGAAGILQFQRTTITVGASLIENSDPPLVDFDWETDKDSNSTTRAIPIIAYTQAPVMVATGDSNVAGHDEFFTYVEHQFPSTGDNRASSMANLIGEGLRIPYQNNAIGNRYLPTATDPTNSIQATFQADVLDKKPKFVVMNGGYRDLLFAIADYGSVAAAKTVVMAAWDSIIESCQDNDIKLIAFGIPPNGQPPNVDPPNDGLSDVLMQARDDWNTTLEAKLVAAGFKYVDLDAYVGEYRDGGDAGNLWNIAEIYRGVTTGTITVFADAGGGFVTVTSDNHGLTEGLTIHISETIDYNGVFVISNVTANTFDIETTFVIDDAIGTWVSTDKTHFNGVGQTKIAEAFNDALIKVRVKGAFEADSVTTSRFQFQTNNDGINRYLVQGDENGQVTTVDPSMMPIPGNNGEIIFNANGIQDTYGFAETSENFRYIKTYLGTTVDALLLGQTNRYGVKIGSTFEHWGSVFGRAEDSISYIGHNTEWGFAAWVARGDPASLGTPINTGQFSMNSNGDLRYFADGDLLDDEVYVPSVRFTIKNPDVLEGGWAYLTDQSFRFSSAIDQTSGGNILAFVDAGGGNTTVTSTNHGLLAGYFVVITGTTNYNGTYAIVSVTDDDNFVIVHAFAGDDATGFWAATSFGTTIARINNTASILADDAEWDGTNYIALDTTASMVYLGTGLFRVYTDASLTAGNSFTPTERFRISESGAWGLTGANYGTSGDVITSNGSGTAPTWQTPLNLSATSDGDILYNNGGVIGGFGDFNDGTNAVTLPGFLTVTTGAVINESGADSDTRIEGDTDVNLLYADASTDRIGIGTATPSVKFDVVGAITASTNILASTGTITANQGAITSGDATHEGSFVSHDGDGNTLIEKVDNLAANVVLDKDVFGVGGFGATLATAAIVGVFGTLPNIEYALISKSDFTTLSFSTVTGDSGTASADSTTDSLKIAGTTNQITTVATDDPEVVTISLPNAVTIGDATNAGSLLLQDGDNETVTLDTQNVSTSYTLSFPTAVSAVNQVLLYDASGDATWANHIYAMPFIRPTTGLTLTAVAQPITLPVPSISTATAINIKVYISTWTVATGADTITVRLLVNGSSVQTFTSAAGTTGVKTSSNFTETITVNDFVQIDARISTTTGGLDTIVIDSATVRVVP